jgi:RimJ/RimL family protein N-acetyltransferase
MAEHFAGVVAEGDGVATEPPVDIDERAGTFARSCGDMLVAEADGRAVGMLHLHVSRFGYAELGVSVERAWRGRGVATALLQAAEAWARGRGLHKLSLEVFATNEAALALYRRLGTSRRGGWSATTGAGTASCGTRS